MFISFGDGEREPYGESRTARTQSALNLLSNYIYQCVLYNALLTANGTEIEIPRKLVIVMLLYWVTKTRGTSPKIFWAAFDAQQNAGLFDLNK